jgi:hypothetical protein
MHCISFFLKVFKKVIMRELNKKIIGTLFFCFLGSNFLIGILFAISRNKSTGKTDFGRFFQPHELNLLQKFDLKYNSYYIAGRTGPLIYLGNVTSPTLLASFNFITSNTESVHLNLPLNSDKSVPNYQLSVDSPCLYAFEGNTPQILYGNLKDKLMVAYPKQNIFFSNAISLSPNNFVFRKYDGILKQNILVKNSFSSTSSHVIEGKDLLQKQVDGLFCTDGMMSFGKKSGKIIYVYYYRNQFICTDSNLHLIYRGNTIDTNHFAKIQIGKISSENKTTFAAPPTLINKSSTISGNFLYVNSNVMADNESPESFKVSSVIDIYDIQKGVYRYSIYVPDLEDKKINQFKVYDHLLTIITGHYLLVYEMHHTG